MAGNYMGSVKKKLGLKGKTKPGDMLTKMNAMNCKTSPMKHKNLGQLIGDTVKGAGQELGYLAGKAGKVGSAIVRNIVGQDSFTRQVRSQSQRNISKYSAPAQNSIKSGLKSGNVRFEPNSSGGEYIYSGDKSFGKKKTRKAKK